MMIVNDVPWRIREHFFTAQVQRARASKNAILVAQNQPGDNPGSVLILRVFLGKLTTVNILLTI